MNSAINKKIAIGAGWMISLRWVDRLIRLISIAILARLLLPVDFGLVAYAMVFLSILDLFFMFGFETVLIRDQDATKASYSTVWTLEVIKGLILFVGIIASAEPVATFFNEPKVEAILYWIAIIPVLKGLVNIGTVDFQKNLTLHKDFYFNVIVSFAGTMTTLVLALFLRNFWALVYGALAHAALRLVMSYVMSDFRPRPCLSEFSRVFGFSKWLFVQNIFSSLNSRLPVIVIGRYLNAQALAFYNMGYEISSLASMEIAAPIRRALYPGIAKMQDDQSQMASTLKMSLGIIVLVGLPATIGIGVTAPLLIPAFLGDNWVEVVPILQALCVFAASLIFYPNSHIIYYAMNRPHITASISILRFLILAPAIILIVPKHGALGAAWALAAVHWLILIVDFLVLYRVTLFRFVDTVSAVWRSTLSVVIMSVCVTFVIADPRIPGIQSSIVLHLAYAIATGMISYVGSTLFLWWLSGRPGGPEAYALRLLSALSGRLKFSGRFARN